MINCSTGDFLNPDNVYEDMTIPDKIKTYMNQQLNEYNNSPGKVRMNLVLFKDAIEHSTSPFPVRFVPSPPPATATHVMNCR